MVVNVVRHFISRADIGPVRTEGLSTHSHFALIEECVGETQDVVLHGVERNLMQLMIDVSLTDVEDLPIPMHHHVTGLP